ncbi:CCR4-NOT transcription complex subunit 1 isoform X1 [Tanacetum coccineum]
MSEIILINGEFPGPRLDVVTNDNISIITKVPGVILRCIGRDEAALAVAQKVFKGLYENASNTGHVGAHLAMLAAIRNVSKLVFKELTSWAPRICWPTVIENLDHEGFYIQDETTFSLLISCYRHASQDPFLLAAVCGNV